MSDPLSSKCLYCGSPAVLDDAWFCERDECWDAYYRETREGYEAKLRTCGLLPLSLPDGCDEPEECTCSPDATRCER